ncbi:UPF0187 chloroplastic [Micractinium conductrix]|uniref:UPF0187 chloroplastic n=1 Tax=Micractinium conductrix TaxID=554055 RepID=A0A2P6VRX4_9CHLO|nr:UPF0187 chloroplastic [Micractinium conductrix]|eukprot:PSC76825.1 UPF0187 chloroplastic [Micractinium conductrix]
MSALLRARVSSFLAGVAVAGVFGVYQLRGDVAEGQAQLLEQTKKYTSGLEARVAELEASVARLQKSSLLLASRPLGAGLVGLRSSQGGLERRRRASARVAAVASPVGDIEGRKPTVDERRESDLKELRSVFDFAAWKRHRSSDRYWRHMTGLWDSRTLDWVGPPLTYVMSVAALVCLYHAAADAGYVAEVIPELKPAATAPFSLTSFALSTLLVLRTNTSYQRWDEARKMWGLIVNRSRDISRQALGYIPATQPELQDMFIRWVVAYSRSLMCHLRAGEDLEKELKDTLGPEELKALMASAHRPNYTVQVLTSIIKAAQLPGEPISNYNSTANVKASAAFRMDENLTCFADVTGGCERILRTPVPLMYTRHNSRFLMIWLTLLPLTLWDSCHWFTMPVTGIVAFLLLGIKEIGVIVEEPFSILPLEKICDTIEGNVRELHATHSADAISAQLAVANAQNSGAASGGVDADTLVNTVVPAVTLRKPAVAAL